MTECVREREWEKRREREREGDRERERDGERHTHTERYRYKGGEESSQQLKMITRWKISFNTNQECGFPVS